MHMREAIIGNGMLGSSEAYSPELSLKDSPIRYGGWSWI